MTKNTDAFEVEGEIIETLPNMMFRVEVKSGKDDMIGNVLLCTLSGKMKMYKIKVMLGDIVKVSVSTYDTSRGRITFREK